MWESAVLFSYLFVQRVARHHRKIRRQNNDSFCSNRIEQLYFLSNLFPSHRLIDSGILDNQSLLQETTGPEDHLASHRYTNRFRPAFDNNDNGRQRRHEHDDDISSTADNHNRKAGVKRKGGRGENGNGNEAKGGYGDALAARTKPKQVLRQSGVTKALLNDPNFKRGVTRSWQVTPLELPCRFDRRSCDADTLFFRLGVQVSGTYRLVW